MPYNDPTSDEKAKPSERRDDVQKANEKMDEAFNDRKPASEMPLQREDDLVPPSPD